MMKKKMWLLSLLCVLFLFSGVVACGGNGENKGVIVGTQDVIVLKATAETYDFGAGVSGTLNGAAADVAIDSSAVEFKKPGRYQVKYTLGDATKTSEVRIYGTPTITAADAEQSYNDARQWKVGVTATDSLGDPITNILVTPPEDYEDGDLLEYGGSGYEVGYTVVDPAGNMATATRKITVSDADRPTFAPVTLTLSDFDGTTAFDTATVLKALDSEGQPVSGLFSEGAYSPAYFAQAGVGTHTFTLELENGWNTLSVTVQAGASTLTLNGNVSGYIFETGSLPELPQAVKDEHDYNNYEIAYEIAPHGTQSFVSAEDFQPVSGEYDFRATAKPAGSQDAATVVGAVQNFTLREGASLHDYTLTAQYMDFFRLDPELGTSLEFVESVEIDGQSSPAYHFTTPADAQVREAKVLLFDTAALAEKIEAGLTTMTFEIATKEYSMDGDAKLQLIWPEVFGNGVLVEGLHPWGSRATNTPVPDGGWVTVSIDFTENFTSPGTPAMYSEDGEGNVTFNYRYFGLCLTPYKIWSMPGRTESSVGQDYYIRNVRFGIKSAQSVAGTYSHAGDDRQVVLNADGTATVDGVDYTFEYYGNNKILFYDAARTVHDFAMTYVPAGGEYIFSAVVAADGTAYIGSLIYEDGDVLALSAENSVVFDLPDFAAVLSEVDGFAYNLYKDGSTTALKTGLGAYTFTEAGLYNWVVSFEKDGAPQTLTYRIYVLENTSVLSKIKTVDKDGRKRSVLRLLDMNGVDPVFEARSLESGNLCLYLDGDFVQEKIDSGTCAFTIYCTEFISGSQCYAMWDGQLSVAKPGCYANMHPASFTYAISPDMLPYEGDVAPGHPAYTRAGNEDLRLEFTATERLEIRAIL